ncbi:cell division protein FtsA [Pasteurellaceae bacterium TAE3-ERU1]|uniref:cell division protein FtsA n=1 Tax=Spirabiliibacterium mucosae TaxID=28156 RepID=UPI001AADA324|nr:cell division protein FtsA [Spirabiliibacterium mucosae]MBE2898025.1 cell division protein FtsA [Spirabiliibacterium mucosae]MBV7387078.1 cell division protein FtsA [Pasteurellaceae bacterium TAE3-ERU1]
MAKIVDSKIKVGLEVGTSKVVAVVGEVLPDGVVNVLGVGSSPSKGIDRGSITDLDAVVNSIQRAIEGAESIADCQIVSVSLAITGDHICSLNESGWVPIGNGEVTQDEIDDAMTIAQSVKIGEGLSILHVIEQEFSVDNQPNIKNPLGLQGVRLQAQAHLIAANQNLLNNLKKAVERANLKVDEVVFSGLASSYSVLTEDEKELGVCLIDIGGGTIDIIGYTNGALRFSKVIPYAGNRVTDDIAYVFSTSRIEAEKIKVAFGSAINLGKDEELRGESEKKIEVPSIGNRPPRVLKRGMLSEVISDRYSELLGLVNNELAKLKQELDAKHIKSDMIAGVVLTGGGAQIHDILACAENVFGPQVRVGTPLNLTGLTDYVNKPQYATVLGLLQHNHDAPDDLTRQDKGGNGFNLLGSVKKMANWVKNQF